MCNLYYADFWIMPIIGSKRSSGGGDRCVGSTIACQGEHYFNDYRTFEEACDRGTKRCAQRARTTRNRLPASSLDYGAGKTMACEIALIA